MQQFLADKKNLRRADGDNRKFITNNTNVIAVTDCYGPKGEKVLANTAGKVLWPAKNNGYEHAAKKRFGHVDSIVMVDWSDK